MKHLKDIVIGLLFIVVVILLILKGCGKGGGVVETIRIDTVWEKVKADTFYVPKPTVVYLPGKAPKALEKWDTMYIEGVTEVDTAAILKDYYSFRVYNDEVKHKYGRTFINDTISQNKVIGRNVSHDLLIPTVTKTITLTQPKKNQVYLGAGLFGNPKEFVSGYEVNISLKTRQDRILEAGYLQEFNGIGYYKLGYKHKISFKR